MEEIENNDPTLHLIQNLFNKPGYKANFKKVVETISEGNEEVLNTVINATFLVLNSQDEFSPETKLFSLRTIKDLMSLKREEIVTKVGEELLPTYLELAQFKREDQDDDRGKTIFGDFEENYVYGNSFLRCVLECLYVWNLWFPGSAFEETYQVLLDLQVKFPKRMSYFKPEELEVPAKPLQKSMKTQEKPGKSRNYEESRENPAETQKPPPNTAELLEEMAVYNQYFENLQENLNFLLNNPQENEVFNDLQALMADFQQIYEKYQGFLQGISQANGEKLEVTEEYLNKIITETEFMETVLQEYAKYARNSIKYEDFRRNFVVFEENVGEKFEETKRPEPEFLESSLKESRNREFLKKNEENSEFHERKPSNTEEILSIHSLSTMKPVQSERFDENLFENTVLSDIKSFNENRKRFLFLMKSEKNEENEILQKIVETCKSVMYSPSTSPISKVLALRFVKEAMDLRNPVLLPMISEEILPILSEIATFDKDSEQNSRGKQIFGKNTENFPEIEKIGLTYFLLAQECLIIWARWHKNSEFSRKFEELRALGVRFPETLHYFKDLGYETECVLRDFEEILGVLAQSLAKNPENCDFQAIFPIIKQISLRLNAEKVADLVAKLQKSPENARIREKIDQKLRFFKEILMEFEQLHAQKRDYKEFRDIFFENFYESKVLQLSFEEIQEKSARSLSLKQAQSFFAEAVSERSENVTKLREKSEKSERFTENSQKFMENSQKFKENSHKFMENSQKFMENSQKFNENSQKFDENSQKFNQNSHIISENSQKFIENSARLSVTSEKIRATAGFSLEIMEKYESSPFFLVEEMFKSENSLSLLVNTLQTALNLEKNLEIKYRALFLLKNAMDLRNEAFAATVSREILEKLDICAENVEKVAQSRGKASKNRDFAENFLQMYCECLKIWSEWFPGAGFERSFLRVSQKFARNLEELTFFDRVSCSFSGFADNKLSEFCFFARKLEETLQIFAKIKGFFLSFVEKCAENRRFFSEIRFENFLHVLEDLCRHQENAHSLETEENVAFFQETLRNFEVFQRVRGENEENLKELLENVRKLGEGSPKKPEILEGFQRNSWEFQENHGEFEANLEEIQGKTLENSKVFSETGEEKNKQSVASMNYNPSILNKKAKKERNFGKNSDFSEEIHENYSESKPSNHKTKEIHVKKQNFEEFEEEKLEVQEKYANFFEKSDNFSESHENFNENRENHDNFNEKPGNFYENRETPGNFNENRETPGNFYEDFYENREEIPNMHENSREIARKVENFSETPMKSEAFREKDHEFREFREKLSQLQAENQELRGNFASFEGRFAQLSQERDEFQRKLARVEQKLDEKDAKILELHELLERKEFELMKLGETHQNSKIQENLQENPENPDKLAEKAKNLQENRENPYKLAENLHNSFENPENSPQKLENSPAKPENHNSQQISPSSSANYLENSELLDSPLEKQLIFPFKTSSEYFSSKTQEKIKGFLVREASGAFPTTISLKSSKQEFRKLKLACLKPKQLIFKGNRVHVGTIARLQRHKNQDFLRISVFLTNFSGETLGNLEFQPVSDEKLAIWTKNSRELLGNGELSHGSQAKFEVIAQLVDVPYAFLKAKIRVFMRNPQKFEDFEVFLPSSLNLFMSWKPVDAQNFAKSWEKSLKSQNIKVFRSLHKEIHAKVWKNAQDLKAFFPSLKEIGETQGKNELAGVFSLSFLEEIEFLLRIAIKLKENKGFFSLKLVEVPSSHAKNLKKVKEFVIRTFLFLLGEEENREIK